MNKKNTKELERKMKNDSEYAGDIADEIEERMKNDPDFWDRVRQAKNSDRPIVIVMKLDDKEIEVHVGEEYG